MSDWLDNITGPSLDLLKSLGLHLPPNTTPIDKNIQNAIAKKNQANDPLWMKLARAGIDVIGGATKGLLGNNPDPDASDSEYVANALTQLGTSGEGLLKAGLPFSKLMKGKPVFHGTNASDDFLKFNPNKYDKSDTLGSFPHFAENPGYADRYASGNMKSARGYKERIIPVNIDAKNVLDLINPNMDDLSQTVASLGKYEKSRAINYFKGIYTERPGTKTNSLASYLRDRLNSEDVINKTPFDAIRYNDMGEPSYAVPSKTPIRTYYGGNHDFHDTPRSLEVKRVDELHPDSSLELHPDRWQHTSLDVEDTPKAESKKFLSLNEKPLQQVPFNSNSQVPSKWVVFNSKNTKTHPAYFATEEQAADFANNHPHFDYTQAGSVHDPYAGTYDNLTNTDPDYIKAYHEANPPPKLNEYTNPTGVSDSVKNVKFQGTASELEDSYIDGFINADEFNYIKEKQFGGQGPSVHTSKKSSTIDTAPSWDNPQFIKNMGGTHGAALYNMGNDGAKIFKPNSYELPLIGEQYGSAIAHKINGVTPEATNFTHNKLGKGTFQNYLGNENIEPLGNHLDPFGDISQLTYEHVIDWLIGNHDAHPEQFLKDSNSGVIYPVDKGQSFKFWKNEKLSPDYHPNNEFGAPEPIYATMKKMGVVNPFDATHLAEEIKYKHGKYLKDEFYNYANEAEDFGLNKDEFLQKQYKKLKTLPSDIFKYWK